MHYARANEKVCTYMFECYACDDGVKHRCMLNEGHEKEEAKSYTFGTHVLTTDPAQHAYVCPVCHIDRES